MEMSHREMIGWALSGAAALFTIVAAGFGAVALGKHSGPEIVAAVAGGAAGAFTALSTAWALANKTSQAPKA